MNAKLPLFYFLAILFLVSGCKSDTPKVNTDDVLDIAMRREPKMINPFLNVSSSARAVYQNIFVSLADFDPVSLELSPVLIKELPKGEKIVDGEYKGGTKYTVEFREEAKWPNGSDITANDLLFSMKAIMHPGTNTANYSSHIKWVSDIKVDKTNPKKAEIFFKEYYILARELVATLEVYPSYHYDPDNILSEFSYKELNSSTSSDLVKSNEKLQAFGKAFNGVKYAREAVVGAGPYELKEWIANQLIVLQKKKDYWAEDLDIPALQAGPETIKFHMIADETSAISQLKEGNIDIFTNMSATSFFDLKENETYGDQFDFFTPELMKFYYIAINNSKPELADPDVRRALAKLMDVEKLVEIIENGLGRQTVGIFNEKKPYYNKNLKPVKYDVKGAQDILKGEGWADSNADGTVDKVINGKKTELDLDIHITGSELSKNVALLFQESAKKAGVKINIVTKKYSDFKRENLKKRDYDLAPLSTTQNIVLDDPYSKWHSDNDDPAKGNDVSYQSEEADELIEKIRSTQDDSERIKSYNDLQKIMYDDQPVIFLYNPQEKIIVNKKWQGIITMKRPGFLPNTYISK